MSGIEEDLVRSHLLMLIVLMQNFHVFGCRSEFVSAFWVPISRNWLLIGGVAAAQGIHLLAINTAFGQSLLQASPVAAAEWTILLGIAAGILVGMELFKLIQHGAAIAWPGNGR